ncbi:MAG: hypothetical protein ACTHKR_01690 [Sphingomonas sp.]
MNPFEMVVAIIIVVTIGKVLQSRFRYSQQAHQADPAEALENRQLRGEVQALKERIQVLERVITDTHSSSDLDREIERLRDRT